MILKNLTATLGILESHYVSPQAVELSIETEDGGDYLSFSSPTDSELNSEEVNSLVAAGWVQPEADFGDEYTEDDYSPSEAWAVKI